MLIQTFLITKILFSLGYRFENQIDDTNEIGSFYGRIDPVDEDLWSAAFCLRKFLENFLHRAEETPLYIATGAEMSHQMNVIFRTMLDGNISVYLLSGNLGYETAYSSSLNAILLAEDPETLLKYTPPNLSLLCSRRCLTFIVILVKKYKNDDEFLEASEKLIQSLWIKKVGNVAITGLVDEEFIFAKSRFFKSGESCRPQNPVILGACAIDGPEMLQISKVMFANIQANKCILKGRYLPRIPYAFLSSGGTVTGVEGEILRAISKFANFNCKSGVIYEDKQSTMVTLLDNLLGQGNITSFVYGGIPWNPEKDIDFTIPYDVSLIEKFKVRLMHLNNFYRR